MPSHCLPDLHLGNDYKCPGKVWTPYPQEETVVNTNNENMKGGKRRRLKNSKTNHKCSKSKRKKSRRRQSGGICPSMGSQLGRNPACNGYPTPSELSWNHRYNSDNLFTFDGSNQKGGKYIRRQRGGDGFYYAVEKNPIGGRAQVSSYRNAAPPTFVGELMSNWSKNNTYRSGGGGSKRHRSGGGGSKRHRSGSTRLRKRSYRKSRKRSRKRCKKRSVHRGGGRVSMRPSKGRTYSIKRHLSNSHKNRQKIRKLSGGRRRLSRRRTSRIRRSSRRNHQSPTYTSNMSNRLFGCRQPGWNSACV